MPGGLWISQNKVLPGFYLNVKSAPPAKLNFGASGVAAICESLNWGPVATPVSITQATDIFQTLGYSITDPEMLFLRELFLGSTTPDGVQRTSGANSVLLYRPAATGAAQAAATMGTLTATAKYPGIRGNDISVSVTADPDNSGYFYVVTAVDGEAQDNQHVNAISALSANSWVTFSGTGSLAASAATALSGGLNGTVASTVYASFLNAIEPLAFNVLVYDGTDSTVQASVVAFVKRLRENQGIKIRAVMPGNAPADYDAITSPVNGIVLSDGTTLTAAQACWWFGGCAAGANYNQSLTYAVHPGAVDVSPKYTLEQAKSYVQSGNLVFFESDGTVRVLSDIDTLTTFTAEKSSAFSMNRTMRTLDYLANYLHTDFGNHNVGQTDNNTAGRNLIKKQIVGLMNTMQANSAIQNFTSDDVTVDAGAAPDSIVVALAVQPLDAIEKIYMTVVVS